MLLHILLIIYYEITYHIKKEITMEVLSIIGIIVGLILVASFVKYTNGYSQRVYNYEIFNKENFVISLLGYVAIYFGNYSYMEALKVHGDLLNGELLVVLGVLFFLAVLYRNIKFTSFLYGFGMTLVTELLYVAAVPVALFILFCIMMFLADTKPVYCVNR